MFFVYAYCEVLTFLSARSELWTKVMTFGYQVKQSKADFARGLTSVSVHLKNWRCYT